MKRSVLLFAALCLGPVAFAQEPDLGTDAQRAAGKELYDLKCSHCHGYEGDAASVATPYLRPTPP